jgi:CRISPR/Cas system-associated protein endoribonuclease Cas2
MRRLRIKNLQQKKDCEGRYGDPSENIPNKILDDYKRDFIDPLAGKGKLGLNIISKESFEKIDKKIRNLSNLGYRLIHFIVYSHLFFANCMGYISNRELEKYSPVKGMTCLEAIEKDWDIIKDLLAQKGINSIQIFMNFIFFRLSSLSKNCILNKNENDRNIFEISVDSTIKNSLVKKVLIYQNKKI